MKKVYILDPEFVRWKAEYYAKQRNVSGTPEYVAFRKRLIPSMVSFFDEIYSAQRKKILNNKIK